MSTIAGIITIAVIAGFFATAAYFLSGLFGPREVDIQTRIAEANGDAPEEYEGQEFPTPPGADINGCVNDDGEEMQPVFKFVRD